MEPVDLDDFRQPTIQSNCKARISTSSDTNGQWRINNVILEHNHKTSPSKSREVQSEFTRKMYCDIISAAMTNIGTTYELAYFASENEEKCCFILDWIEEQRGEMSSMYLSSVKNLMPQHTAPNPSENKNIGAIRDPVLSKRKDAPRKLRRKNPLESRSHKVKATSASSKGKSQRKIYSDLQTDDTSVQDAILRDFSDGNGYQEGLTQQSLASNSTPSPASFTFNVKNKQIILQATIIHKLIKTLARHCEQSLYFPQV
ncbi:Far-red impaired responsive (FAR1) family protein, partial [Striga asiatica]